MNAQDELDQISDRLRVIEFPNEPEQMVSLHSIYCPCELCAAVRYKEKLIRDYGVSWDRRNG
jgi:hypothetical protein